jgi:hypothetical protein
MNELSIEKVNNDIIKLRRLNIKIDIVNNHIKNLLEKTNIYIRGFGKINIDRTINEIADNLDDLYIMKDDYKQEIADIECSYNFNDGEYKNIYEYKYHIEKEKNIKII